MPDSRIVISAAELASHWGITERRLRELTRDGVAVRARGGLDLRESDKRFIEKLRGHEDGRRARAALLHRQTQRAEFDLARESNQVMRRSDADAQAQAWWGTTWAAVAAAISRIYYDLPGTNDERRAICTRLHDEIRGEMVLHRERICGIFLAPETPRDGLDRALAKLGIRDLRPSEADA